MSSAATLRALTGALLVTATAVLPHEGRTLLPDSPVVARRVYPSLLERAADGTLRPGLAESWRIEVRTSMSLKAGARLPDGKTASVATVESYFRQAVLGTRLGRGVHVEAAGPDRLRFTTDRPGPGLVEDLESLCPGIFQRSTSDVQQRVTFKLPSAPVGFEKILVKSMKTHREVRLESPYGGLFSEVQGVVVSGQEVVSMSGLSYSALEAWSAPLVGTDASSVRRGGLPVRAALVRMGSLADPERQKLRRAIQGMELESTTTPLHLLCCGADAGMMDTAVRVAQAWRRGGARAHVEGARQDEFRRRLGDRRFQVVLGRFPASLLEDPKTWWHSSRVAKGGNPAGYTDPECDQRVEELDETFDLKDRRELQGRIREHLERQAILILLPARSIP